MSQLRNPIAIFKPEYLLSPYPGVAELPFSSPSHRFLVSFQDLGALSHFDQISFLLARRFFNSAHSLIECPYDDLQFIGYSIPRKLKTRGEIGRIS